MKTRFLLLFGLSIGVASGAAIASQSFNALTWAGSSAAGYTEYSVTTTGSIGLEFVNVVSSSGQWLVQNSSQQLIAHYSITAKLGQGGQGIVFVSRSTAGKRGAEDRSVNPYRRRY